MSPQMRNFIYAVLLTTPVLPIGVARAQDAPTALPAAAPAAAPAPAAVQPQAGEILLEGIVESLGGDGLSLKLQATSFTLPGKPARGISPPKTKTIMYKVQAVSVTPGAPPLRAGARVRVIGADNGTGTDLTARAIVVLAGNASTGNAPATNPPVTNSPATNAPGTAAPAEPALGSTRRNPLDGAEMVYVPAGEFQMGYAEADSVPAERPQHSVYVDGYWIYKNLVTVGQYMAFCAATKRQMPAGDAKPKWGWQEQHPMVFITWDDARAYATWAGAQLPTEAQWEKAARGTDGRKFPWGNQIDPTRLWGSKQQDGDAGSTAPAGSFPSGASPYGALDMDGNVWEWTADWFNPNYYQNAPTRNPTGPTTGRAKAIRNSHWHRLVSNPFRVTLRMGLVTANSNDMLGFRCAIPATLVNTTATQVANPQAAGNGQAGPAVVTVATRATTDGLATRGQNLLPPLTDPSWALNLTGQAKATSTAEGGALQINVMSVDATPAQPWVAWHVALSRVTPGLENGQTYRLSFTAKADTPHTISAITQVAGKSPTGAVAQAWLTPAWQNFQTTFTVRDVVPGDHLAPYFPLGQQVGTVWLKDVSLVRVAQPAPTANLLPPIDDASWELGLVEQTSGTKGLDDDAIKVTIRKANGTNWHAQLHHDTRGIKNGQRYRLSFKARADQDRPIQVYSEAINPANPPTGLDFKTNVNDWQTFETVFTAKNVDNGTHYLPNFLFGTQPGTVWLKDISLTAE